MHAEGNHGCTITHSTAIKKYFFWSNLKAAKQTLLEWANADARNPAPNAQLVSMLLEDGDAADAVAAAEAGVARLPEEKKKDERLQLLMGRAQIAAGMKEEGHHTLLALMKTTGLCELVLEP